MNRKVHEVAAANGGRVVGEEYFPVDHADWVETVDKINDSGADIVFNMTVPPGCFPFLEALSASGFTERGGLVVTTYFDENLVAALPTEHTEGLYGCIDYYQSVGDSFSQELLDGYNTRFPEGPHFSAGSGCTGIYRGLKLWEAAVTEAGSLEQDAVVAALDHAAIAEGPGGASEMVPGQHHVRLNGYIAQVRNNRLEVVESLGAIDPNEPVRVIA
jgi:urea transport system substrate-binding protein